MGLFGKKKPTEFDEDQNKQLQALAKNQAILIKNNDVTVQNDKNHWAWIQHLLKRVEALEAADKQFKVADADMNKRLESIGASLYNAAKAKSETVEGEA